MKLIEVGCMGRVRTREKKKVSNKVFECGASVIAGSGAVVMGRWGCGKSESL
jgi:hypothetical protein